MRQSQKHLNTQRHYLYHFNHHFVWFMNGFWKLFSIKFRYDFRLNFQTCDSKDHIWKTYTKSRSKPSKNDQNSFKNRCQIQIIIFDRFFFKFGSNITPFWLPNPSKSLQTSIQRPPQSLQDTTQAPKAFQKHPKRLPRRPKDPPKTHFGSLVHPKTSLRTTMFESGISSFQNRFAEVYFRRPAARHLPHDPSARPQTAGTSKTKGIL